MDINEKIESVIRSVETQRKRWAQRTGEKHTPAVWVNRIAAQVGSVASQASRAHDCAARRRAEDAESYLSMMKTSLKMLAAECALALEDMDERSAPELLGSDQDSWCGKGAASEEDAERIRSTLRKKKKKSKKTARPGTRRKKR